MQPREHKQNKQKLGKSSETMDLQEHLKDLNQEEKEMNQNEKKIEKQCNFRF